ncbi:hypothetical protein NC653_010516 [Populus alba x Populus x berolinensis]|uniref:Uncharacterized protein n=1 Tax=Populus alba x Populus x berolinensis TaxID=444605 RepID=A0AAD6QZY3_9ROSI|nr:hypothetical protein NC653_010516 [Populus alba x Populus x berolinensis]
MNERSHCSLCSVMFGKEAKFKLKFCKKLIMIPGSLTWLMLDQEIDSAIPGLLAFGCKKPCHSSHSNKLFNVACLAFSFAALMYDRRSRSQSCPFCRDSLKRVNSGDLWVFTDSRDIVDMATVTRDNLRRLFMYVDKLPLIIPDNLFDTYDSHVR